MRSAEAVDTATLHDLARARFEQSMRVPRLVFGRYAAEIAQVGRALAQAFRGGGRLLVYGAGAEASDALHVAVEFVHPVIVGKRALSALALQGDAASQLAVLGTDRDVLLAVCARGDAAARVLVQDARARGMRTIVLTAEASGAWHADHVFAVAATDDFVIQEVHETLYHVFWELTHVFLEHEGTHAT